MLFTKRPALFEQKGAVSVEFAIILPVLLLLAFGIIEFSVALYDKAMITNASREGARAGIVYTFDPNNSSGPNHPLDAQIAQVVQTYCQNKLLTFNPSGSNVTVNISRTGTGDDAGDSLRVTVNYNYDFLALPSFVAALAGGINLQATTIMRLE
jgi:Flp pilus assembly protein TadG